MLRVDAITSGEGSGKDNVGCPDCRGTIWAFSLHHCFFVIARQFTSAQFFVGHSSSISRMISSAHLTALNTAATVAGTLLPPLY